ncbi:MAG TPA: hypothetical protein VFZ48_02710, partial [Candidatus Saccharimonadales bacterium]
SVRRAEQYVLGYKKGTAAPDKRAQAVKFTRTETPTTRLLAKRLKTPVQVKTTAKGGQLIINFKDESDLERISKLLG